MITHDEYEHKKYHEILIGMLEDHGTQETAIKNIITQIYEDGYQDGYNEREALGDLNLPKGGHYPY